MLCFLPFFALQRDFLLLVFSFLYVNVDMFLLGYKILFLTHCLFRWKNWQEDNSSRSKVCPLRRKGIANHNTLVYKVHNNFTLCFTPGYILFLNPTFKVTLHTCNKHSFNPILCKRFPLQWTWFHQVGYNIIVDPDQFWGTSLHLAYISLKLTFVNLSLRTDQGHVIR